MTKYMVGETYRRARQDEWPPPPPALYFAMKPLWNDVKPSMTDWNVSSAGRMVVLTWHDDFMRQRAHSHTRRRRGWEVGSPNPMNAYMQCERNHVSAVLLQKDETHLLCIKQQGERLPRDTRKTWSHYHTCGTPHIFEHMP